MTGVGRVSDRVVRVGPEGMTRDVSAYLDIVRFVAALAVLVCHVEETWLPGLLPAATHLGYAAVGVFFVLSGFVIAWVTDAKEHELGSYVLNRAARLYSVVVPCLVLTFLLDLLGRHLLADYYAATWPALPSVGREAVDLVLSLGFLNEAWGIGLMPGSDAPYWSISFEVAYYAIFALAVFTRGWWRVALPVAACLLAGPRIVSLLPLWLVGLGTYRLCRRCTLSVTAGRCILVGAVAAWVASEAVRLRLGLGLGVPYGFYRSEWQLWAAGLPFAATVLGVRFGDVSMADRLPWLRWMAGSTFTLYLIHFPLGRMISGLLPAGWPIGARWCVLVVACVAAALCLASVTERRKHAWRRAIVLTIHLLQCDIGYAALRFRRFRTSSFQPKQPVAARRADESADPVIPIVGTSANAVPAEI